MENLPPHPPAYLARWEKDPEREHKMDIAFYVANNLVDPGGAFFVSTGTTAAMAGLEIMAQHASARAFTHSMPFVWHFMEFAHRQLLQANFMEIVAGPVNPMTGIVMKNVPEKIPSKVFLYSPHGLDGGNATGNRDIDVIQNALKHHSHIIILATKTKFLRKGSEIIKHVGHIKKEVAGKKRQYDLVISQRPTPGLKPEDEAEIALVEKTLAAQGVKIHKAKETKKSVWQKYFNPPHR